MHADVCGGLWSKSRQFAFQWEILKFARDLGPKPVRAGFPSFIGCLGCLTWKRSVVGVSAADPGAPEPLGMVVQPTTGLLRKIEVAVESGGKLQIFV